MTKSTALKINKRFYYGHIIVFVSAFSMFFSAPGQTFAIAAFIDAYIEAFDFSRTTIATIYSVATLCSGMLLIIIGKLVDRFGQRLMLVVCGILLGVTAFYNSFVMTIPMIAVGFFFLRYFGQGSLPLIPSTLVPQWFKKKRGMAFSIFKFGGAIAAVIVPVINIYMIQTIGWQMAWRVWSLLLLAVFVPVAYILTINTPEEIGLRPDNLVLSASEHDIEAKEVEEESWHVNEAIRTKSFWLLGLSSMVTPLVGTGIGFHFFSILSEKGIEATSAAVILGFMGIPGFIFPLIAGYIIDHIGAKKILVGSLLTEALGLIILVLSTTQVTLIIAVIIIGIGSSTQFVAGGVMWPNFFGRKYLGSIQGIATVFGVFGSALGPIPFAYAFDTTGTYNVILYGVVVVIILGALMASFANTPIKKGA